MIDGDLTDAERHYRLAADGFRRTDRPVMLAITLGVLADLDERHGHSRRGGRRVRGGCRRSPRTSACEVSSGSLYSRLAWSLLEEGDVSRAASTIDQALDAGRRLRSPHILFLAHAGSALLQRAQGRNDDAATAANEALLIHETNGPSRFRNRIDPDFEIASVLAVCHTVLGVIAVEQGDTRHRRGAAGRGRSAPVPRSVLQCRGSNSTTSSALGPLALVE